MRSRYFEPEDISDSYVVTRDITDENGAGWWLEGYWYGHRCDAIRYLKERGFSGEEANAYLDELIKSLV